MLGLKPGPLRPADGCCLEGLGGMKQSMIGALAAIGLATGGDAGRMVYLASWSYAEDGFSSPREIGGIRSRGINEIRQVGTKNWVPVGSVDARQSRRFICGTF
jgi:hypothetical protein